MKALVLLLVVPLALVTAHDYMVNDYVSTDTCQESDSECRFIFVVESKLTMLNHDDLAVPNGGKLYNATDVDLLNPIDGDTVIQGDGYYQNSRLVIVVNNSLPGPPIEVYVGQTVIVEVRNQLLSDGVTVHWHGVVQKDKNFMDGVAYVNQCPIAPGTTFTYRFKSNHQGTNFYHAHIGVLRSQGLFGAFITKRKTIDRTARDEFREYTMIVNEWNHDYDASVGNLKDVYGTYDETGVKFVPNKNIDNSINSPFVWHSGLINGKGRYHNPKDRAHNGAPLTVYKVKHGETIRFRVISAASVFPFRVTIDQHDLTMIATDSYMFKNFTVESFILHPGERYDFLVTATQKSGSYWIYAETLEANVDGMPLMSHKAEAIFEYEEAPMANTNYDANVETWSNRKRCNQTNPCNVLNCPFPRNFTMSAHQHCKYLTDLSAVKRTQFPPNREIEERFYNFAFAGPEGGSINGRHWINPQFSAASQSRELKDINTTCDECNENKTCSCTHTAKLKHDKLYQFVLMSSGKGTGEGHPIHLHGHNFQVVKQGFFYPLDSFTHTLPDPPLTSPDIICLGSTCNSAKWANVSWVGAGLNDQIISRPILKDTVLIPPGGYTVIRFKANNPGFWYMHCNAELHNGHGMAMMFNEAPDRQKKKGPFSFPVCRNFPSKYGVSNVTHVVKWRYRKLNTTKSPHSAFIEVNLPECVNCSKDKIIGIADTGMSHLEIGLLVGLLVALSIAIVILLCCIIGKCCHNTMILPLPTKEDKSTETSLEL